VSGDLRPELGIRVVLWIAVTLVIYLCWRLVAPFVSALAFAFALAMLGNPLYRWLLKKLGGKNTAAVISVVVICLTLVVPVIFLVQVLVREAIQGITAVSDQKDLGDIRNTLENSVLFGPLLRWLDSRLDLPKEAAQIARGAMQWFSTLTSSIISGSAWAITQMATMVIVLFYFLRDQETILVILRSLVPLSEKETDRLFARVTETIRI
jgi:predicted PurR-regulated permease PerM